MFGNYENELNNVTRMDGNLNKGPLPRWQRKALESSLNNSVKLSNLSLNLSVAGNVGVAGVAGVAGAGSSSRSKTPSPGRRRNGSRDHMTPGNRKTPERGVGSGDRFIPSRSGTDFERSQFHLVRKSEEGGNAASPSKREYQRLMAETLQSDAEKSSRILSYSNKAPAAPEGHANNLKVLYSQSAKTPGGAAGKKSARHIPQVPEKILDAPEIMNDYYLNLLDWSTNNHLAVALGPQIYLWNAANGEIRQLMELEGEEEYVASVRWIKEGNYLSVGLSTGEIQLWDVENYKKIRSLSGHSDRVGALSWNQYVLSSGSRSGQIRHSDVRVAQHHVGTLNGHTQEVCGLAWSPNGRMLASGGNDNVLNVWNAAQGECFTDTNPLYTFTHHQAAVKAVSWCPWQPNVLASGGGTADRCIRIWNCNTGTLLNTVDTKSQVCALLWSKEYKELVSSHGFANNEVTLWKYPSMVKTAELIGHTERVLHLALSPDGSTVVSAGADETLRLWKCFAPDPAKKSEITKTKTQTSNALKARIR